jgi:hypothetical protein
MQGNVQLHHHQRMSGPTLSGFAGHIHVCLNSRRPRLCPPLQTKLSTGWRDPGKEVLVHYVGCSQPWTVRCVAFMLPKTKREELSPGNLINTPFLKSWG